MSSKSQKRALVTGASGDLGKAIAKQLALDGFAVLAHYNGNAVAAETLAESITETGGQCTPLQFDVTDGAAARTALEAALADGPIQAVVSNAGIHDDAPLVGMKPEQWQRVVDVSLHGFYNAVQPLLMPMMRTRWGRVVAVSSVAGQVGNRGQANYAAAKAGLHGAVKSLGMELASRGVTANVVAPGIIAGKMTDGLFPDEHIRHMVPARRMGQPDEVAKVVSFLCSDAASYVCGQVIGVNGGMA